MQEEPNQKAAFGEYETCVTVIGETQNRIWYSASIFLSGALVVVGWTAEKALSEPSSIDALLATASAVFLAALLLPYRRVLLNWEFAIELEYGRCREIERESGMLRSRLRLSENHPEFPNEKEREKVQARRAAALEAMALDRKKFERGWGSRRALLWIVRLPIITATGLAVASWTLALGLA